MKNLKYIFFAFLIFPLGGYAEDLLIKNGDIHIGDGSKSFKGDIYIQNGVIKKIGDLDISASRTIDASNKILSR